MAAAMDDDAEDGITSINITPLVDVFLVLLIIVMISSSLLKHKEIPVSVPKAATGTDQAPKASGIAIDVDKRLYLDGNELDTLKVSSMLRERVAQDSSHQVLIAADQRLIYEEVVKVLDMVKSAGITKYALKVAKPE